MLVCGAAAVVTLPQLMLARGYALFFTTQPLIMMTVTVCSRSCPHERVRPGAAGAGPPGPRCARARALAAAAAGAAGQDRCCVRASDEGARARRAQVQQWPHAVHGPPAQYIYAYPRRPAPPLRCPCMGW